MAGPPRSSEPGPGAAHAVDEATRGSRLPWSYAVVQFLLLLGATVVLLDDLGRAPFADVTAYGALARRLELLRLAAVGLAALTPGLRDAGLGPTNLLLGSVIVSLTGIPLTTPGAQALREPPALENSDALR